MGRAIPRQMNLDHIKYKEAREQCSTMVSASVPDFRYLPWPLSALFPQVDELFNQQNETNLSLAKLMLVMMLITEAEKQTRMENLRNIRRYDLQAFFRDKEKDRMEFSK